MNFQSPPTAEQVTVRCRYHDITYSNADGTFMVGRYTAFTDNEGLPDEIIREDYSFIAKGCLLPDVKYLDVIFKGCWRVDNKYKNLYLAVEVPEIEAPRSRTGIIIYLSSGIIKGIDKKLAERIYEHFGMRSLEMLETDPDRLLTIKGIGKEKMQKIVTSYKEATALKALTAFLAPYHVSMHLIVKIYQEFGDGALNLIKADPFVLSGLKGFSFPLLDMIARKSGSPLDSYLRMKSAVRHVLQENNKQGHLYMAKGGFLQSVIKLLTKGLPRDTVPLESVKASINRMVADNTLNYVKEQIYLWEDFIHEDAAARDIVRLLGARTPRVAPLLLEALIDQSESYFDIKLSEKQREAVRSVFLSPLHIITGTPGTGKTTVIKVIIYIQQKLTRTDTGIVTVAPTGRAASRMSETTELAAKTLHKALNLFPDSEEAVETENCFDNAVMVIVDEVSMVDMRLCCELLRKVRGGTRLVLAGDSEQLPSVGPGNVLKELLATDLISRTVLDVIYRQDEMSAILRNTERIRKGETDLEYNDSDFVLLPAKSEKEANEIILSVYEQEVPAAGANNVQVLCPRRVDCICCANELNREIQETVNPYRRSQPQLQLSGRTLRIGDKVIQTRNTEHISNGDTGVINYIHTDGDKANISVDIQFDACRSPFNYDLEACADIELAYAMSIHKSQGSEYDAVIIPILYAQKNMLRRNLIYTAISRGKAKVILVGSEAAIALAISKNDSGSRNTMLARRILALYQGRMKKSA